jgi:hypothetical protein
VGAGNGGNGLLCREVVTAAYKLSGRKHDFRGNIRPTEHIQASIM